jgi:hypothetical protein
VGKKQNKLYIHHRFLLFMLLMRLQRLYENRHYIQIVFAVFQHSYVSVYILCAMCVQTVGSNYSQYDGTSSGSETVPLNPAPARGAATAKPEHQTLLDIDNPEQNANSFGKPFESSVSTRSCESYATTGALLWLYTEPLLEIKN